MHIPQYLQQDGLFYHQLHFPGQQPTLFSWLKILFRSRGLLVIAVHRLSQYCAWRCTKGTTGFLFKPLIHFGVFLSRVLAKSSIELSTIFEPGVYLSDRGHIILGARSIGAGTLIHHRVTIGMNLMNEGIPEIGRDVWIGPQCIIYGAIKIGDGATLLPGTLLTKSLPPGVMAQGNPARIVKRGFDNTDLRRTLATDIGPMLGLNNC